MSTPSLSQPRTLTARCPEDLLALVPFMLGFVPSRSLVMLTFGPRPFHARIDLPLPHDRAALAEMVDALVEPAQRHGVERVVAVVYSDDATHTRHVVRELEAGLEHVGVRLLESLRFHQDRWWPARGRRPGVGPDGVAVDLTTHPFTAEAVLDGRVTLGSRDELARSLAHVPDEELDAMFEAHLESAAEELTHLGPEERVSEAVELVEFLVGDGRAPREPTLAWLLLALQHREIMTAVWRCTCPPGGGEVTPREEAAWWSAVLRRAPEAYRAAPAALLSWAAWRSGHGALAWCAVDVALAEPGDHSLARTVADLLERAVSPHELDGLDLLQVRGA